MINLINTEEVTNLEITESNIESSDEELIYYDDDNDIIDNVILNDKYDNEELIGKYSQLSVKKKFLDGRHVGKVSLLENNIIKKEYPKTHNNIFLHETYAMRKLQKCTFIPKLYAIDNDKRTIYMSYCGNVTKDFDKYKSKIEKYNQIMIKDYGIYHNDLRQGNICINKNKLYIIDFGWAREYPGIAGHGSGKIGHVKTKHHTTKKDILDVLMTIYKNGYDKELIEKTLKNEHIL